MKSIQEILDDKIDECYKFVPKDVKNDFANHIGVDYNIALLAMGVLYERMFKVLSN